VIRAEASTTIACSPARVFALLDDFARIPEWNDRCVEIRQTSEGEHATGKKLIYRYRYRDRGAEGVIDGELTEYEPGRAIAMHYEDHALEIRVRFDLESDGSGTRLVHRAEIQPKSFKVKLLSPIIRAATRKQTEQSVEKIRALVEAAA
jgi:uncharacterized protein YndB with AHSA1/START domain